MQKFYNTALIVALIKDDLVSNKLISGLNDLGLNASDYHLGLSEKILVLMGLDVDNYAVHDLYIKLTQECTFLDLSNITERDKHLNQLAMGIYTELLKCKQ